MTTTLSSNTYTTIISAQALSALLADESRKTIVLDCRYDLTNPQAGKQAYDGGHLPGALYADLEHDLAGAKQGPDGSFRGRHPLPDRATWIATLRNWGITDGTQVVAYDAQGGMFAARLWWMLRWAGHPAAAVLDGGIGAWQQEAHTITTEAPAAPAASDFEGHPSLVTSVDAATLAADLIAQSQQQPAAYAVVDARSPDRYRGENETLDPVGGHIPGAKNRFFKDNLQPDGRFKTAATLRAEWLPLLASDGTRRNVMQCGSGVTACHNLLALEVAGLTGASLYPGSWSEWCSDKDRPVATGA